MARDMAVWLDSIAVKDLGPIREKTFHLGRLNLIYGHNETGKTFLVELLLRSLFRKSSDWKLRDLPGQGKIIVQGLGDKPVDFTPDTRQKLEDYWEESELGLPTNMARLLVVKGSELELAESRAGLDRKVLKTILSGEELLDTILDRINTTVQDAHIENGVIVGHKRGAIKSRAETINKLKQVNELLDRVDERYSRSLIRSLELREEEISREIDGQKRAKRYKAYKLDSRIKSLENQRAQFDDENIDKLGQAIRDYRRTENELERKQDELEKLSDATDNYEWVEKAVNVWQSMQLGRIGAPHWIFLVLGMLSIIGGFAAGLLQILFPSIIAFVLGLILTAYYIWKLRNRARSSPEADERLNIQSEFRDRFNEPLTNLATLKAKEKSLHEDHIRSQTLADDIEGLQNDLEQCRSDIDGLFISLSGSAFPEDAWEEELNGIKKRCNDLDNDLDDLRFELEVLNVDESDYVTEEVEPSYNPERLNKLEEQINQIQDEIKVANDDLGDLKKDIYKNIDKVTGEDWSVILQQLRGRKLELEREYRAVTAEIIAKIGVVEVLNVIKQEEEEKIQRGLQDVAVRETMKHVTGSYNNLQITDDKILALGEYGNHPLDQLSTGAKEQILLALRMGLSTRVTEGKPLFLILDDAFQLSDWDRREKLVETVTDLVKDGWQITYLTMDDHIRDLFKVAGKKYFNDDFTVHLID